MKFRLVLIALRISVTSRWPQVTRLYWKNRRRRADTFNDEPIFFYRSKDCKRQRARMAARRPDSFNRRAKVQNINPKCELQYPKITICLVTYNSQNWIPGWIKAIAACEYPHDKLSLSVVDNASTDKTIDTLEKCLSTAPHLKLHAFHKSESNLGFGRGQNIAIDNAADEYILVINPDAFLKPGSLSKAIEFSLNDESDVCAWEFSQLPYEHPKYYDPVTLETSWNAHACVLLKKSAVIAAGGYDNSLFMYGEDVDLSYKLRAAGFRLRYLPKSKVLHDGFLLHGKRDEQSVRIIAANLGLRRRYGTFSDRLVGCLMVLRSRLSTQDNVKKTYKKAWRIYKKNRPNFKPTKRKNVYFPFNGFSFERRRPGAQVEVQGNQGALPKISVITRIHKKTDVLGDALISVKNQSYSNVEHVIVFDKCEPYFISGQKVVQSSFATRSEAANAGAFESTGEYLLFLDYDDVLFADHLEGLMGAIRENPEAVCAYALSWEAMSSNRQNGADKGLGLQNGMESEYSAAKLQHQNFFAIQSLLIKRSAFESVGGFNENLDKLEDWDLWIKLSKQGEFAPFSKVTSIFYTPSNILSRFKRALDLLP